ncbi:hypothetical protein Aglo01_09490 [Actinokineospora globicatena]|nr:hypothetical protein Aglo01_09490 [Actinokineospora globicatena]GLW83302.1 hypothetical protein Aglo02_09420 [Actinokineospora globicatena]
MLEVPKSTATRSTRATSLAATATHPGGMSNVTLRGWLRIAAGEGVSCLRFAAVVGSPAALRTGASFELCSMGRGAANVVSRT